MANVTLRTWEDNWNQVLRYVIFDDPVLMNLMMVPKDINILDFLKKYWIEDQNGADLLTNEQVRIISYTSTNGTTGVRKVIPKTKEFDIYVREDVLYGADPIDALRKRTILIKDRQKYLLTNQVYTHHLRFDYVDGMDSWTKMVGYKRYHVIFSYNETI